MKKYLFIFALFLTLVCCASLVCAADNATDDAVAADEALAAENDNDCMVAVNEGIPEKTPQSNVAVVSADEASPQTVKEKLNVETDTNVIKTGKNYQMYLKDSKGNAVANKKISVNYNGKDYARTTDKNGLFCLKISESKSSAELKVTFTGDDKYDAFTQTLTVHITKTVPITIGNKKLLTQGYLRIYLHGSKKAISGKTVKITIGSKTFTRKTTAEGFVVMKPNMPAKTYKITVEYDKYRVSKTVKCVKGKVKDPLKTYVKRIDGVPDIDVMPAKYVMGDKNAKYTLKKAHYKETLKRDSWCLFLYNKLSKYTFFRTKDAPKVYHILKRGNWNVIERALNVKLVKKNRYSYWPKSITVSIGGKSYTYGVVRDVQNTEYTCGPTAASVCSQALKKYFSEKFFQVKGHVTSGINFEDLKRVVDRNGFRSSSFSYVDAGVSQLKKGGCALIAFLPNHYVAVVDVSKDGKKILVSNSYGKYDVGGDSRVPTKWVSLKYFKSKFAGVGMVVKLNYKLSKKDKKTVKNYYKSMGKNFPMKNTKERIPNT